MKEDSSKNKRLQHTRDRFKMDPPENAWNLLDAQLERKQAMIYRQRGNRFKWLSIGLALLLISAITYYYISPVRQSALVSVVEKSVVNPMNDDHQNISTDQAAANNTKVEGASGRATSVFKGGLGTWDKGHSPSVPRSSSFNEEQAAISRGASDEQDNGTSGVNNDNSIAKNESNIAGRDESDKVSRDPVAGIPGDFDVSSPDEAISSSSAANSNSPEETACEDQAAPPSMINENKALNDSILNIGKSNKSRWSIAAFYSPNLYARNRLVANNSLYTNYLADYGTREKPEYSFAAGLTLGYDLTSQWSISAGCNYSTISYSINLPTVYARVGSDDQMHYQYPTSCGNIEIPNTKNTVLYYGDSLNMTGACAQVVNFINVPVTVRFKEGEGRVTFFADAGFSANFVLQEKANMNIWNSETTVTDNIDGLKKMNYGYLFGAGLQYNIYSDMGIFIEPVFRGSITSLTENTSFYCYPYAFSLSTGLSFHF